MPSNPNDPRYDYADCATCGGQFQKIDFYGNPHAFLCRDPKPQGWPVEWRTLAEIRAMLEGGSK